MFSVCETPIGRLTAYYERDTLVSLSFTPQAALLPAEDEFGQMVIQQLYEYFCGIRMTFDIPLQFTGSPFSVKVWNALLEIPYGETHSYGEIAAYIGNPNASRAVGRAVGMNPVIIIVPCHRIIPSDGSLGHYSAGGAEIKRKLLRLEGIEV